MANTIIITLFFYKHHILLIIIIIASTCFGVMKSVGYCKWKFNNVSCYVEGGECYCDPLCVHFGDCCADVNGKN